MTHRNLTLVVAAVAIVLGTTAPATAAQPDVKIGMYPAMFRDVPPDVVVILAKPMRLFLQNSVGVTGDAELVTDAEALAQALDAKTLNLGVFHGFEYARLKAAHPNLEPILLATPHGDELKSHLIVPITSKAKTIADLGKQPVLMAKGTKAHCQVFLDHLRKGLPDGAVPTNHQAKLFFDDAMTELVTGQHAAAIVDAGSLAAHLSVYPGNKNGFRILSTSESFPLGGLVINKTNFDPTLRTKICSVLTTANNNSHGKPLMMMWNLKSFDAVPNTYDAQLEKLLKDYPAAKPVLVAKPVSLEKDNPK